MTTFRESGVLDLDGDGRAEFGTFGELSAAAFVRGTRRPLDPPLLSGAFRASDREGLVQRSGYHFRIWLPGRGGRATHELPVAGTPAPCSADAPPTGFG